MGWLSFLGSTWGLIGAGVVTLVGAIWYLLKDPIKKETEPILGHYVGRAIKKYGPRLPPKDQEKPAPKPQPPKEVPAPEPHSTEKADARRKWPGRPLHGPLEFEERKAWERLIEIFGVDWRVIHNYGHVVAQPEPLCPRCRDDILFGRARLSTDEAPATFLTCANAACGFTDEIPLELGEFVRQVRQKLEGQLRREARG